MRSLFGVHHWSLSQKQESVAVLGLEHKLVPEPNESPKFLLTINSHRPKLFRSQHGVTFGQREAESKCWNVHT